MTKFGDIFKDLRKLRDELRESSARDEHVADKVLRGRQVEVRVRKSHDYPGKPPVARGGRVPAHPGPPNDLRSSPKNRLETSTARGHAPLAEHKPVTPPNIVAKPVVTPAPTPRREERWADMARLRIGAADAFSRNLALDVADVHNQGELAIIGLDFGTAFTKAVVRFGGRDYAVEWDQVARLEGGDKYLMPTCFSEDESGRVVLGAKTASGWKTHQGIKMALLQGAVLDNPSPASIDAAILFVSQTMRYVQRWTRENATRARNAAIRWRLHLGLPSAVASGPLQALFQSIGSAGYQMAIAPGLLRRSSIPKFAVASIPQVAVLPELQAQLNAYHLSKQRQDDLHVLVDVGAGTLDCAFFLDHKAEARGDVIAVLGCRVEQLGAHYLLAALAGAAGEKCEWHDGDSSLDNAAIAVQTGEDPVDIDFRRRKYRVRFERAFEDSYQGAYRSYRKGPVNLKEQPLRVFMCGGGSRIEGIRKIVESNLQAQFVKNGRVSGFRLSELPCPDEGSFVYSGINYDRMSVAHGLCETKLSLGTIYWDMQDQPIVSSARDIRDRDEDR